MSSSGVEEKNEKNSNKPQWKFVKKNKANGGKNFEFECNYCHLLFRGSYTRVRAHLFKISRKGIRVCESITTLKLQELKKIDSEATLLIKSSKGKPIPLLPLSLQ